LARNLDGLFAADRASFMVDLSAHAIREQQLITQGHNKDHRADCKQIVLGLNITGDGPVPLS